MVLIRDNVPEKRVASEQIETEKFCGATHDVLRDRNCLFRIRTE